MASEQQITIGSDERCFITGKTGSGKTYLARHLLRTLPRLVVLDPKATLEKWRLETWQKESRRALREGDEVRVRVLLDPTRDPTEFWEGVLEEVYQAGNCTVYIDEVYSLAPQGTWAPPVMQAIWTRGRELGIGAFAASQRPRWVPKFILSEAEHFFAFRLLLRADREYMAEFMGEQVALEIPREHEHGFWYMHVRDYDPLYVERLDIPQGPGLGEFEVEVAQEVE